LPSAPGSWASFATVVFFALTSPYLHVALQSVFLVVIFFAGIWSAKHYAAQTGIEDPPEVVIDEIAGQWLALVGFEATWSNLLLAFFFFRVFDIWKPLPIRLGEKLPEGLGIMVDDILAGIAAHFAVAFINRFLLV